MHTARMWMTSAIPGGAPGYDDDKEFGNFITHMAAQTSRRLREHNDHPEKSREGTNGRDFGRLAGSRRSARAKIRLAAMRIAPEPAFRGARKREPQMCNCTSGNLEIPVRSFHERPGMTVLKPLLGRLRLQPTRIPAADAGTR